MSNQPQSLFFKEKTCTNMNLNNVQQKIDWLEFAVEKNCMNHSKLYYNHKEQKNKKHTAKSMLKMQLNYAKLVYYIV